MSTVLTEKKIVKIPMQYYTMICTAVKNDKFQIYD